MGIWAGNGKRLFIETLIQTQRRQGAKKLNYKISLRLGAFALRKIRESWCVLSTRAQARAY
jgi:hypothetical protein